MKITNAIWFTQMGEAKIIGIIIGEDEETGEMKAYIGTGYGINETIDANHIAKTGAKLHPVTLSGIVKQLNNDEHGK